MKARHVIALLAAPLLVAFYVQFITWAVGMGCSFANAQTCHVRLDHFFDPETTWLTLGVGFVALLLVFYALRGARKGKTHDQN